MVGAVVVDGVVDCVVGCSVVGGDGESVCCFVVDDVEGACVALVVGTE